MALSDDDKLVKASNARYLFQRSISGKVTGAKSGWQTLTFSRPLRAAPGVTATAEGQGAIVNVRNVTANGFDYQVINTPSGQDINFYWRADMAEMVSSPLIDDINKALGTSFRTIGELLSSNTGMASLAGNETARNLLLGVPDLYPQVANSQNAVNQLFGNDAAYAAVKAKTNLLNQIKGSSWGYLKWWIREAGSSDVSSVVNVQTAAANSAFAAGANTKALIDNLVSDAGRLSELIQTPLGMNKIIKAGPYARAAVGIEMARSDIYKPILVNTLMTSPQYFKRTVVKATPPTTFQYETFEYVGKGLAETKWVYGGRDDTRETIRESLAAQVSDFECVVVINQTNYDLGRPRTSALCLEPFVTRDKDIGADSDSQPDGYKAYYALWGNVEPGVGTMTDEGSFPLVSVGGVGAFSGEEGASSNVETHMTDVDIYDAL